MTSTSHIERAKAATNDRVALFIDVDNVLILSQNAGLPFYLPLIVDRARQQGTLMSAKAYADWTSTLLGPFLREFRASAIELVQLLTSTSSREHKNTADIQLAVDALEMVFLPVRPDTVVIVGGDRDYVPLVQKLKRYGVFVMGMGVQGGVSVPLTQACDSFVFYDDILPLAQEEVEEPTSLPDPEEAYSLMFRAVEALTRDGRASTSASVFAMMKQLAPTFDLDRYKTTFRALAQDAQRAGYIALSETPGADLVFTTRSTSIARPMPVAQPAAREYDYSTPDTIAASYRRILQDHRIPLLPWAARQKFVQLLWDTLASRGVHGMSLHTMRETLEDYATEHRLPVWRPTLQKLMYSLNFARCFSKQRSPAIGYQVRVPDEVHDPLFPVVNMDEAIDRVHKRYIEILAGDGAALYPDVVFDLLYGSDIADDEEVQRRKQGVEAICRNVKPMSALGQALLEASRQS